MPNKNDQLLAVLSVSIPEVLRLVRVAKTASPEDERHLEEAAALLGSILDLTEAAIMERPKEVPTEGDCSSEPSE